MSILRNMKIKNKLLLPVFFQVILLVVFIVFYFRISSLTGIQDEDKNLMMDTCVHMKTVQGSINDYFTGEKPYEQLVEEYQAFVETVRLKGVLEDTSQMKALTGLEEAFKSLNETITQNKEIEKQVMEGLAQDLTGQEEEIVKEANAKTKESVTRLIENSEKIDQAKKNILEIYGGVFQSINQEASQQTASVFKSVREIFFILFLVMIFIILAMAVLSLRLIRLINRPLHAMIERAYDLAVDDVDMTQRLQVDSKDEIGELAGWFNKFLERLHQLILKVRQGSDEVHRSTAEITSGSDDLATRTSKQAASITETSTTLEQFTKTIRQNTKDSAEADMMLTSFNGEIQEKKTLVENVTNTMTEIYDSSNEIDNIIKVINDISFQTNLLALNAAVEAARAGEAGRGFAVVAAEVRNLAQKTAESSKTIQDIVHKNVETTQKGMQLVKDASQFFAEIVEMMGETVTKISNITESSRQQSNGIEQINKAIGHMDEVSNRNTALVEQLSAAGRNVKNNAMELQNLVAQFKLDETSDSKGSDSFTPPDAAKTTPTEEDFFGSEDEEFEEF